MYTGTLAKGFINLLAVAPQNTSSLLICIDMTDWCYMLPTTYCPIENCECEQTSIKMASSSLARCPLSSSNSSTSYTIAPHHSDSTTEQQPSLKTPLATMHFISILSAVALLASSALAQSCSTRDDCPGDQVCAREFPIPFRLIPFTAESQPEGSTHD